MTKADEARESPYRSEQVVFGDFVKPSQIDNSDVIRGIDEEILTT
ncbi:MAG: hypothetical protein U5L09_00490 [Bacteroidales bacterium]|nr:hypothetical protein [Bacteroidales bacterium]